jgi:SAM-dependent methyltransferase
MENLYHRDYYLKDCEGFGEFLRTQGRKLPRRLAKCLALAALRPLDEVALKLVGEAIRAWDAAPEGGEKMAPFPASRPLRVLARGEALPVGAGWAAVLFLTDVVEHLRAAELAQLLAESRRVLKRGGRLVIHTQPNRTLVRFTVPFLSRFSRLWGTALPHDLRTELTRGSSAAYHPGEQSLWSLKAALAKAGFQIEEIWLEGSYAVHRVFGETRLKKLLLPLFRRSRLLKELLATQIFALAKKP